MFKIGDFSRLSRVTVKTLRYYDEIGLFRPVRVDGFTGYRYYSADQLPLLNRILALKDLGLSLEDIARVLTEDLPLPQMRDILRQRQGELAQELTAAQERLVRLEGWLRYAEQEGAMPAYEVVIKSSTAQKVASLREVVPTYSDVGRLMGEMFAHLGRYGVAPVGAAMAIYHDQEFKERDVDIEAAVPVGRDFPTTDRILIRELPAEPSLACVVHKGPYDKIGEAYNALMAWTGSNGYSITGNAREVYLTDPAQVKDPSQYVTEVQLPVAKT